MKKRFCFLIALLLLLLCALPQTSHAAATPAAGKVATNGYYLNVREKATTSSSIVTKLKDQSWITLLEKDGRWWRVRYDDERYGYCYDSYIVQRNGSSHAVMLVDGKTANVYRGEGTQYEIKKVLSNGSCVAVLTQGEIWSCILYFGTHKGYVRTSELRECKVAPVSLNVKRYAQTDPRWKDTPIGTKGGTIGSIGCTTTCLAMVETYKTGQTVTPPMMAKRLNYSAGGSLYWPANYTVQYADKETLLRVYEQLQKGNPVVFGAKKDNSTQHWVVVTGCDGSALSPAAFTILDPASAARKTLAQYLAVYPNPYKTAWR